MSFYTATGVYKKYKENMTNISLNNNCKTELMNLSFGNYIGQQDSIPLNDSQNKSFINTNVLLSTDAPICNRQKICVAREYDMPYCYGKNDDCDWSNPCVDDSDCKKRYNNNTNKYAGGTLCSHDPRGWSKDGCSNPLTNKL